MQNILTIIPKRVILNDLTKGLHQECNHSDHDCHFHDDEDFFHNISHILEKSQDRTLDLIACSQKLEEDNTKFAQEIKVIKNQIKLKTKKTDDDMKSAREGGQYLDFHIDVNKET